MNKINTPILKIKNLKCFFYSERGVVKALNGVNIFLEENQVLGIIGETGCGKSLTVKSIIRLLPSKAAEIVEGEILFKGKDLLRLTEKDLRKIRGKEISMIFQDPTSSLNPTVRVGNQIIEAIRVHQNFNFREAHEMMLSTLELTGMPNPNRISKLYPFELSGGMQQRIMIAIALVCKPSILIADEPTTSLDVTIQAQILELIKKLQKELHFSTIFISHDFGVISESCDYVDVMYAGMIVEIARIDTIVNNPKHPYTKGLLDAIPTGEQGKKLGIIKGDLPDLTNLPSGCLFEPRCQQAMPICRRQKPQEREVEPEHFVSCHLH